MNNLDLLVEATILQISFDNPAKTLTIELESADKGCVYIVRADEVYDALMDGVRLNNIVDEVLSYPDSVSDAELLSALQLLMTGDAAPYYPAKYPSVDSKAEELRQGHMRLWKFCPVYGGSLLVLAKDLSLTKVA